MIKKNKKTKKGYNLSKGFLFDYNWETVFRRLDPVDCYTLFFELLDYQKSNGEIKVPPHEGDPIIETIIALIIPQINNRLAGSLGGRMAAKYDTREEGIVPPVTAGEVHKTSEEEKREEELSEADEIREYGEESSPSEACAYGEFSNVMLTREEHSALEARFGTNAQRLINIFSIKLRSKGYRYEDHYAAILSWAEEDGIEHSGEKSYVMDDFFEASLRRAQEDFLGGEQL